MKHIFMSEIIKKSDTKKVGEHSVSVFTEYPANFKNLSVGVSLINGKYPSEGFDVDTEIEQVWYVESGSGQIYLNNEVTNIVEGDMIVLSPGDKYWIQGDALKLVVSSSPPWFAQQHKHINGN
jgi:mannose-6-phosphate isomerase-like protein (cupin superfamily)